MRGTALQRGDRGGIDEVRGSRVVSVRGEDAPKPRRQLTSLLRPRLAILASGLAFALPALAASGANAFEAGLEYSGTLLAEGPTGLEKTGPSEHNFGKIKLQLSWTATGHTTSAPVLGAWHFTSLSGTAHFDTKGAKSGPVEECTATLSARPGAESFFTIAPNGSGFQVSTEVPASSQALQSSDNSEDSCSINAFLAKVDPDGFARFFEGSASASELEKLGGAEKPVFNVPAGGPWSAPFSDVFTREVPSGAGDPYLVEISSTLVVGTTGSVQSATTTPPPTSPTPFGPEFNKAKKAAEEDMRNTAIGNAERLCLPYAGGLVMAGAGILTLGLGPAGGILAMTGTLASSALTPFCKAAATRLGKDYKTFKDPPLDSIGVLAEPAAAPSSSLPSCGRYRAKIKKLCTKLRAPLSSLGSAAAKVAADATAVEETVSRESAAAAAHNQMAVTAQDAQLGTLLSRETGDEAGETAAGKAVAAVLRAAHIGFKLSKKQSAKVIAHAEAELATQGVTAAELRSFDAAALVPAKTNVLSALSSL